MRTGNVPAPILPDGDMVSMPIPTEESSGLKFEEIFYQDGLMPKCGKN